MNNRFPSRHAQYKIALIFEKPEAGEKVAFEGQNARFLAVFAGRAGIDLNCCYRGYLSNPQATGTTDNALTVLGNELETYSPNLVVLFGSRVFANAKTGEKLSAAKWRGTVFKSDKGVCNGLKCLVTLDPENVRTFSYDDLPYLQFDLRRAAIQGCFPDLRPPQRRFITDATHETQIAMLRDLRRHPRLVAVDIEGRIDTMSCISFSPDPSWGFIIPFYRKDGTYVGNWEVWKELVAVLEDPRVPKVLQNSLYDRFVLAHSYGITIHGTVDDTMLKHWEMYNELEKSLGVQVSIYTDEGYYKGDIKSQDDQTFYEYCCRDSALTLEISQKIDSFNPGLNQGQLAHYRMNIGMLNPFLYMELRGTRYDVAQSIQRRSNIQNKLYELQARFNGLTNHGFKWDDKRYILQRAHDTMCFKKYAFTGTFNPTIALKPSQEDAQRFHTLVQQPNPSLATIGEIENLCEVSLNVSSSKQFLPFLYEHLKLPTQMSEKRGEDSHPTADYEALLKLKKIIKDSDKYPPSYEKIITSAMEIRSLQTRQSMLGISADKDGRIRCGYNIVGSNTGRIACYQSPTGSGYNLQTIPKYEDLAKAPGNILGDRDLFLADENHWFFQCDLAGADGWTVAAYSAMLGDTTLLDDYLYGLKPARNLALVLRGLANEGTSREELKILGKKVKGSDWDYFAAKRVQHGCSYLEGARTVSRNVMKDSEGELIMSEAECKKLMVFFFNRYRGIKSWHDWMVRRLAERAVLTAASGQTRIFFGRPGDVITKAVAFEPQSNTTYAINLAIYKLWRDPDNRCNLEKIQSHTEQVQGKSPIVPCGLRIEPLHQVHDALCGQFRKDDTAWAVSKIKSYFLNPLKIANQTITIPFEGGYGPSWGDLHEGEI